MLAMAAPGAPLTAMGGIAPAAKYVVVQSIEGPIAQREGFSWSTGYVEGYDGIESRFNESLEDENASAVILRINSPGGAVPGCFDTVRRMRAAALASGKPVAALIDESATSAAFAIACVATAGIFAPVLGRTASIGAMMLHADESGAFAAAGIKLTVIRAPEDKAEGIDVEPLSPETRARFQASISRATDLFVAWVSETRGISAAKILDTRGRVLLAEDALKLGLIDKIASFEDVVGNVYDQAKVDEDEDEEEEEHQMNEKQIKEMAAALGLPETASIEQINAKIRENAATVARVQAITGEATAPKIDAALATFAVSHQRVEQVAKERAEEKERKRTKMVAKAVARGALPPAVAFARLPDAKDPKDTGELAPAYASMPIDVLEDHLSRLTSTSSVRALKPLEHSDTANASDADAELARKYGIKNPDSIASARADIAQHNMTLHATRA